MQANGEKCEETGSKPEWNCMLWLQLGHTSSSKKKTKNPPPSIVFGFMNVLTACAGLIFSHLHVTV